MVRKDSIAEVHKEKQQLEDEMANASQFVEGIRAGDLEAEYLGLEGRQNQLAESLLDMRDHLKRSAEEEEQRVWTTEGIAKFVDILRTNYETLEDFSANVILALIKYLKANQGSLFVINDEDPDDVYLSLKGCYAYDRHKHFDKKIYPGEGLAGQALFERDVIHMTDVPDGYINITSGLGEASPSSILIVPLMLNEEIFGVVELASFTPFLQYQVEFIQKVGENIASSISKVKTSENTQKLLKDTQHVTEALQAQEEEMRQNMEEMQAIQEGMEGKQREIEESQNKSQAVFQGATDSIFLFNTDGIIEDLNKTACEAFGYECKDVIGANIAPLIKGFNLKMYERLLTKKRRMRGVKKDGDFFTVEVSMSEACLDNRKLLILYARDITALLERESQVAETLMEMDRMKAELEELKGGGKEEK